MAGREEVVRIDRIHVDPKYQPRTAGLDPAHVAVLHEAVESWPPLIAVMVGTLLTLIDGFHRLAAAMNLGLTEIRVLIVDPPEDGDLAWLAFSYNAKHGRMLFLSDRRREADRVLRQHPQMSDREIGRHCGLAQPTVAKIRSGLEASAQIEQPATRTGRDGRSYPAPPSREEAPELIRVLRRLIVVLDTMADLPEWSSPRQFARTIRGTVDESNASDIVAYLKDRAGTLLDLANALEARS